MSDMHFLCLSDEASVSLPVISTRGATIMHQIEMYSRNYHFTIPRVNRIASVLFARSKLFASLSLSC